MCVCVCVYVYVYVYVYNILYLDTRHLPPNGLCVTYPSNKNMYVSNSQITFVSLCVALVRNEFISSHANFKLSPIPQANKKYLRMVRCCPRKCLFHLQECLLGGRLWIPGSTFQRDDDIYLQQTYRLLSLSRQTILSHWAHCSSHVLFQVISSIRLYGH